jgi:hypothetical protein
MAIDGYWGYAEIPSDLSVGHAANGFHEDEAIDIRSFLPVCCGECLSTK